MIMSVVDLLLAAMNVPSELNCAPPPPRPLPPPNMDQKLQSVNLHLYYGVLKNYWGLQNLTALARQKAQTKLYWQAINVEPTRLL